jgi:hypothetical protein
MKYFIFTILFLFLAAGVFAQAEPEYSDDLIYAQVRDVRIIETSPDTYTFYVTVRHNDRGWDHYADLWQVVDTETGDVLGERVLAHPHDNEQPFTRSQRGIEISEGTETVTVRAKCTQHGYNGKQVIIDLSEPKGENYSIER